MNKPVRTGLPMLSRVIAVMLGAVLAVQFANFALLQYTPLPQPPVFTVAQVADVLRAGRATPEVRMNLRSDPPPTEQGRGVRLAAAFANELGVGTGLVRLSFVDPPLIGRAPPPPGGRPPERLSNDRNALLVGDFTAALQQGDGRWLTVQPVRSGMDAWRLRLVFWLLAALATVAPFAWLLARWVTRPIAAFADAAERIGRDPRTDPMTTAGPAEIGNAARAMNEMQRRLNRYVDDRTLMIGAIAHDLRTPLMRLALRLEHAPEALRRGVDRDVADMQAMIGAATSYVRGETTTGSRQRLDLSSLAETAVDDLADRGEQASFLPGDQVVIDGDPVALRSVIDNLLTNAIRYAGDAEVSVYRDGEVAVIEVRDHGPGLADDDMSRVFEPFFRGEQSRSRETGGMGLGLASVRGVVHMHCGVAVIRNHPAGGLIVRVELPI